MIDKVQGFKNACTECLDTFSLHQLRVYGREIGVDVPTKKKKGDLIADIVSILAGELEPIERSKLGAPVKNERVDPDIERAIAKQRYVWFAGVEPQVHVTYFESHMGNRNPLVVQSSDNSMTYEQYQAQTIYSGQLEVIDDVPCLVSKDGDTNVDRLLVSIELLRQYGLREGDVITCHAYEKMGVWAAKNVLTINSLVPGTETRFIYEEEEIGYPSKRIRFQTDGIESDTAKYMDYYLPIGFGQRCLISSAPKAGKSVFLRDLAKSISEKRRTAQLFVLLIDQSPELISSYQTFIQKGNLVATTFENEADAHVFAAEFLLKRAKRYAEMGVDVVLIVDSLAKVAKAYNDTDFSVGGKTLPCGLESKTLHYVKKYFGAARAFADKGSLTVIGSASFSTGDAMDDVLYSELSAIANAEIRLDEALARRRVFPAVDLTASYSSCADALLSEEEKSAEKYLREKVIPSFGEEKARQIILSSANFDEFCQNMK